MGWLGKGLIDGGLVDVDFSDDTLYGSYTLNEATNLSKYKPACCGLVSVLQMSLHYVGDCLIALSSMHPECVRFFTTADFFHQLRIYQAAGVIGFDSI